MHQLYYVSTFFNAVPHTSNASSPCRCHGQHPYSSYGLTTARWTCSLTFSWRSINNRNQKEIQAKRQGVNNCQQYPCKSSLTSFLWFFQNKMQCFLILFCHTRKPSQLRNTVLTPREIIPTRLNNLLQGVRSIGKLYVPPENSTYTPARSSSLSFPLYQWYNHPSLDHWIGNRTAKFQVFVMFGGLQRFPMNGLLAFNWRFRA